MFNRHNIRVGLSIVVISFRWYVVMSHLIFYSHTHTSLSVNSLVFNVAPTIFWSTTNPTIATTIDLLYSETITISVLLQTYAHYKYNLCILMHGKMYFTTFYRILITSGKPHKTTSEVNTVRNLTGDQRFFHGTRSINFPCPAY